MNLSSWTLGWRTLWRDLRAGELRLLMVAVTLAVAALSSVGFFADRLQGGLQRDARQLLGGDVVLVSDHAPAPGWTQRAAAEGLDSVLTLGFPTMGRAPEAQGGATRLVALKAVERGYPLRGRLRLAQHAQDRAGTPTDAVPASGQVWVDPSLLEALALRRGDTLLLGDSALRITELIALEPDRGTGFMSFAPRVLMNAADLPATGLVQPASRITWRLALAGPEPAVQRYRAWAEAELARPGMAGLRLETLDTGRPEMRTTLDRAAKFLNLVALLAALLSAVAVALAARAFAARHLDDCAMLRVLGLPQRRIAGAYVTEFGLVGLSASLAGVLIGWLVHHIFVALLAGLVDSALPAPGPWPALLGLGIGMTLLVAFGLPPVLQLAQVPPLRVLRRDVGALRPASLAVLGLGVAGFAALLLAVSADLTLGLIAVGGFAVAVALFALLSWVAVRLLRRWVHEQRAPRWLVLATRQLSARPAYAVVQVSSLAVGLLALVLLVLLRTDLIASWRAATPADAPNRFVINIMPEQGEAFRAVLRQAGVTRMDWYPMFRGRLVAINGQPVNPADYPEERARHLVDREFNLSHAAERPAHNDIAAGHWTTDEAGAISVEQGLAETLRLRLGDRLRFDVAGMPLEARITSLRKVDWASMHVNFFAMFPRADMPDVPVTWIAAYRAPGQPGFDHALVRQFPNITHVDMEQSIAQVQRVLDQVVRAVEFLFGFTLAAGLIVLFAAVSATREERAREFAVMRAVGAGSALLARVQQAELVGVGLLAGVLASAVAMGIGWAMARHAFDFHWTASPWVPLLGGVAGAGLALAAGWWGLREVLQRPVVQTLRRVAE
ncbi:MAG TPA: FtsX-like permease family protein [Ottowia sp.]|uniref:ABC transporter permease n=1 Tax=Ottowia sp. TaxID=1898956 RepID=UPI002CDC36E7|nr:FtsX-like permease family protein [Ottowia sp.]HNI84401.1 FtsX-like permease family protein [Ottowia sp.]HNJ44539.1 FtsX-like permease family protein [Ottowia sp.]HNN32969.1 FtsX-like permease family protein [Ottowia sp.]HNO41198.1 FtsX-like permease family protein [Ottowia sp.]HNR82974.1 FtsX-like permease family protein [Ottowia sp.]